MAAHIVQRYGNTPHRGLSPVSVPLFRVTALPVVGLVGHAGPLPPVVRSISLMACMPSTELTAADSLRVLIVNSPLVTPHGAPGLTGHDCGGARNVIAPPWVAPPLNESKDTVWLACSVNLPNRPSGVTSENGTCCCVTISISLACPILPADAGCTPIQASTGLPVALENCTVV